jgi:hypothetical protein
MSIRKSDTCTFGAQSVSIYLFHFHEAFKAPSKPPRSNPFRQVMNLENQSEFAHLNVKALAMLFNKY